MREEVQHRHSDVEWHIAMMPGKGMVLNKDTPLGATLDKLETIKEQIRAKDGASTSGDQAPVKWSSVSFTANVSL
jgi:hypothetical protein